MTPNKPAMGILVRPIRAVKVDPVAGIPGTGGAAPLPSNDVVQSLGIVQLQAGASTALTDITVAGLTITDDRTFTQAGTIIG